MDEDQAKRFEQLEEKLRCLEHAPLSHAEPGERREGIEENARQSEQNKEVSSLHVSSPAVEAVSGRIERRSPSMPSSRSAESDGEKLGQASLSRQIIRTESDLRFDLPMETRASRATTRRSDLETQTIRECQERLNDLTQDTVKETLRRLQSLTDELIPALHAGMQKSLEQSAGVLVRRAAESIDRRIQMAIGCGMNAALDRMKVAALRAASGTAITQESQGGRSAEGVGNQQREMARALVPVIEEIQTKSAAFFDNLQSLLQNTFRAFQDKATKQIGEEFRKIGDELLEHEVGRHLARREGVERPDGEIQSPSRCLEINEQQISVERAARDHDQPTGFCVNGSAAPGLKPRELHHDGSCGLDAGKPRTNAPKWRILGLGGLLLSAVSAFLGAYR